MNKEFLNWIDTLQPWLIQIINENLDLKSRDTIIRGADLCIEQYINNNKSKRTREKIIEDEDQHKIVVQKIHSVSNLFALSDCVEMNFNENFTLIYGANGSGKSSITKMLIYASGRKINIQPNKFKKKDELTNYKIDYLIDNNQKIYSYSDPSESIEMDIFDNETGDRFIESDNNLSIESSELLFLQQLAEYCDNVKDELKKRYKELENQIIINPIPNSYNISQITDIYNIIVGTNTENATKELDKLVWNDEKQEKLNLLKETLNIEEYAKKIKKLSSSLKNIELLLDNLQDIFELFSDENLENLKNDKNELCSKNNQSKEYAEKVFLKEKIGSIGSETWKTMWEAARKYSEYEKENGNPDINVEVCALCKQPLSLEAKNRMKDFENYVKSDIENSVKTIKDKVENNSLLKFAINTMLINDLSNAVFCDNHDITNSLVEECEALIRWQKLQKHANEPFNIPNLTNIKDVICKLEALQISERKKLFLLMNDSKRISNENKLKIWEGYKWLIDSKDYLSKIINIRKQLEIISASTSFTSTSKITNHSKLISNSIFSDKYEKAFNDALVSLDASNLHAKLVPGNATKGRGSYRIVLDNNGESINTKDILSSGEKRIISLAAFIADNTNKSNIIPFIFDDPVSSLDDDYEFSVAKALYDLSKNRQVIVFTHKLSLVSKICDINDDIAKIQISRYLNNYCGDIDNEPVIMVKKQNKIKSELNNLKTKTNALKSNKDNDSLDTQQQKYQGLISKYRTLIEGTIESVLLEGIVQRYKKNIMSTKVTKLSKISESECIIIDQLMTKYSYLEHYQPETCNFKLPDIDSFLNDIDKLLTLIANHKREK